MDEEKAPTVAIVVVLLLGGIWWIGPISAVPRLRPGDRATLRTASARESPITESAPIATVESPNNVLRDALNERPLIDFASLESPKMQFSHPSPGPMMRRDALDEDVTQDFLFTPAIRGNRRAARTPSLGNNDVASADISSPSRAARARDDRATMRDGRRFPEKHAAGGKPRTLQADEASSFKPAALTAPASDRVYPRDRRAGAIVDVTPESAPASISQAHRAAPAPKTTPARAKRIRPLLLSRFLGLKAFHPPPTELRPPTALLALDLHRPRTTPTGESAPFTPAALSDFESIDPARIHADKRADPHWDGDRWHDGNTRGVPRNERWAWLYRDPSGWWGASGSGQTPLFRHDGAWWTKESGIWFIVHDGKPWAWRQFREWGRSGLYNPETGTQMIYSRDLLRVAVISPGHGAVVYNAVNGDELAQIPESLLDRRQRARPMRTGAGLSPTPDFD